MKTSLPEKSHSQCPQAILPPFPGSSQTAPARQQSPSKAPNLDSKKPVVFRDTNMHSFYSQNSLVSKTMSSMFISRKLAMSKGPRPQGALGTHLHRQGATQEVTLFCCHR